MVKRIPDPTEAWDAWQNDNNSIQRVARQVIPSPLVTGAPYPHAHTLGAIRQAQAILDGGGELLGAELVTNGAFAADTDWTKGLGWTIAAGVATSDGQATNLSQAVATVTGTTYRVVFTTSGGTYAAGLVVTLGGAAVATAIVDGTVSVDVVAGAGADIVFAIALASDFIGNVDDVSVKELIA